MSFVLIPFKSGHALSPVVLKAYTAQAISTMEDRLSADDVKPLAAKAKMEVPQIDEHFEDLSKLSHGFQLWRMLDVGASVFLWTSIGLWISFCVKLAAIRRDIFADSSASPETYATSAHAETARHVACSFLVATWHSPHACYSTVGIFDLDERSYIMQVQRHVRWARDARIR